MKQEVGARWGALGRAGLRSRPGLRSGRHVLPPSRALKALSRALAPLRAQHVPPVTCAYNTLTIASPESFLSPFAPHAQHVPPVTRTYNTLMIACNTSSQWAEALRVYEEMAAAGHEPNTTTYNALISGGWNLGVDS